MMISSNNVHGLDGWEVAGLSHGRVKLCGSVKPNRLVTRCMGLSRAEGALLQEANHV
ncbi:hypothetical protein [Lichenihabitans psoromatis]|uniref:hypothetical protein n=1 Tax=Lichenihabitans psoromatis TaxID=2528642 RepID=UPI0013F14FB9|nr:hypothetical protein [Lichenihabitans psoromatis]